MTNNKQQTEHIVDANEMINSVEWLIDKHFGGIENCTPDFRNHIKQAKEMEKERMIKIIQFIVSEKELVDYSSVSKETANYYLDKFNQGGEQ